MKEEKAAVSREKYERRTRRKIVSISFSQEEYERIVDQAARDGTLGKRKGRKKPIPSVFLKKIISASLDERSPVPEYLNNELRNVRLEIRRIGNNINQAIKLAHSLKNKKTGTGNPINIEYELRQSLFRLHEVEEQLENFVDAAINSSGKHS